MKMPDEYQVKDDTNRVKIHTTSSEEKCFPVLLNGKYACGTTDLISTGVAKSLHRLLLISSLLKEPKEKVMKYLSGSNWFQWCKFQRRQCHVFKTLPHSLSSAVKSECFFSSHKIGFMSEQWQIF